MEIKTTNQIIKSLQDISKMKSLCLMIMVKDGLLLII